MIDKDTILSVHDDRMTLLQWLKTVEEKQNGIAIKSINYSKESVEGAFEYGFIHIEFEDGKVLNSPEFTLANSEELNNVITELATKQDALTPQKLIDFFAPSTDIVLDVAEDTRHVEIHLDNELSNKIDKALVHPVVAPSSPVLVAIDGSNAQQQVKISRGLSLANGFLFNSNVPTCYVVLNLPFVGTLKNRKLILIGHGIFSTDVIDVNYVFDNLRKFGFVDMGRFGSDFGSLGQAFIAYTDDTKPNQRYVENVYSIFSVRRDKQYIGINGYNDNSIIAIDEITIEAKDNI